MGSLPAAMKPMTGRAGIRSRAVGHPSLHHPPADRTAANSLFLSFRIFLQNKTWCWFTAKVINSGTSH